MSNIENDDKWGDDWANEEITLVQEKPPIIVLTHRQVWVATAAYVATMAVLALLAEAIL